MKLIVNTFGTEIRLGEEVVVEPESPTLHAVLGALRDRYPAPLERFITEDLAPTVGSAILMNGRNVLLMDGRITPVQDGDEFTFTVQVAGG